MNIGQCVCSSLMGPCKLHAALSMDVLCTKIRSDGFNGSEHPLMLVVDSHGQLKHIKGVPGIWGGESDVEEKHLQLADAV